MHIEPVHMWTWIGIGLKVDWNRMLYIAIAWFPVCVLVVPMHHVMLMTVWALKALG